MSERDNRRQLFGIGRGDDQHRHVITGGPDIFTEQAKAGFVVAQVIGTNDLRKAVAELGRTG